MPIPPDEPAIVDTTAALESLYQSPFAEFITRRNALVSQLKRSGHKDVAARIAGAAKPSRAVYLVNQVYWQARALYDAVLDAGTVARSAQQARLLGDSDADLGDTLRQRDIAIAAAVTRADRIASQEEQPLSEAIRAQVRGSFEALAAHGVEGRLPHGQLTADVEAPGLAAFAGLVVAPSAPAPARNFEVVARRPEPAPPAADEPEPDPKIAAAEARLAEVISREEAATERLSELERALGGAQAVLDEAEAAFEAAKRQLSSARQDVARGEQSRDQASRDLDRARQERDSAARHVETLRSESARPGRRTAPTRASDRAKKGPSSKARPTPAPRPPRG